MTPPPPTPLAAALRRMQRILCIAGVVLVIGEVGAALVLSTNVASLALAVVATSLLVAVQVLVLPRVASDPDRLVLWVGLSYVAKILVLLGAVQAAKVFDGDVRFVAVSAVVVVLVALGVEMWVLVRARVPAVDPKS
ncbi:hypothetical protein I6B53_04535 [Schaalia sp. 19OD2882]|uniref:hypothetical protein n=1 Tax=Schaalia sp. 19OD2882 TaxID=2794089 RepID=UPI001C1EDB2C|nr:hypothetical protein [Schaalia sp. 19OD2882]QWW20357.1 hypothetical protein I6B53_04535 [Schaalia sp. 19OD2882]